MADTAQPLPVRFAVLTVSDTRTPATDKSGSNLADRMTEAGHVVVERRIVPDDVAAIRAAVEGWLAGDAVDAIVSTGGTGLTARDVTPEALEPLFEKRMDGFAAVFHRISYETIGTSTLQSRATAGVARGKLIFALPGSPGACRDAWDGILRQQFDSRQKPCNFTEILPRLAGR